MNTRIYHVSLSLFLAGLLITGCGVLGSDNEESGNEGSLIPLDVGNSWTYEVLDEGEQDLAILNVEETATINGTQYYVIVPSEGYWNDIYIAPHEEGLVVAESQPRMEREEAVRDNILLRYPIDDGETYTHTSEDGDHAYEISVTREEINVPAGTFDSYRYRIDAGPGASFHYYLSPGVGVVQIADEDRAEQGELDSFSVD